jgi:hypothetical protein
MPGDLFIALVAIATLSGWMIVRALRRGRIEIHGVIIDRRRRPFVYWGSLAIYAALPVAFLAYVLAA